MNNNEKLDLLKNSLSNFLDKIREVNEDYSQDVKYEIFQLYKELYGNYETIDHNLINSSFTSEEIRAIHFLRIGKEQEDKFDELVKLIKSDSQGTIDAVTDFIKSRKGFDLINSKETFEDFTDDELVDIFGSLFGVKIAKDCVKSLRAERVGSVIGYALSGLCEHHLQEYNKNKNQDFAVFIKNKINESDVTVSFTYTTDGTTKNITCDVNELLGIKDGTRPKNRFDHCFINHKEKRIVFGLSLSSQTTESQKFSYYQIYQVLEELVKTKMIDGEINKYYGYKIEPFYFMAGRFVADNEKKTQEVGVSFLKMFPKITKDEKNELAQLIFFSIYANSPSVDGTAKIPLFNPFISGCDTLGIHLWQESFKKDNNKLEHLTYVANKITNVTKIINNSNFSLDESGKTFAFTYINDIQNIVLSFGRGFKQKLDQEQYNNIILPLYKELETLKDKMNGNEYGSVAIDSLGRVTEYLESVASYNKFIEKAHVVKDLPVVLKNSQKNVFQVTKQNLELIATIAEQLSNTTYNASKFLSNYAGILRCVISGVPVDDAKRRYYSSVSSYNVSKNSACYSATNKAIWQFIEKTSFLIKKDFDSEYTKSLRFGIQLNELNEFINNTLFDSHRPALEKTIKKISEKKFKIH